MASNLVINYLNPAAFTVEVFNYQNTVVCVLGILFWVSNVWVRVIQVFMKMIRQIADKVKILISFLHAESFFVFCVSSCNVS